MNLTDDYEENDIVGFKEFERYISYKHKLPEIDKKNSRINYSDKKDFNNSQFNESNDDSIAQKDTSNVKRIASSNIDKVSKLGLSSITDDYENIKHTNIANAEPGTEYYELSFSILESIISKDKSLFKIMQN